MEKRVQAGSGYLIISQGDITEMRVDAIVNAANDKLILGGGVAGAIRRKGGPSIQEECDRIGGIFVGGAVITTAGELPAHKVIHAVGPRMGEGDENNKLKKATLNSLLLAEKQGLSSIAFPAISTGIFGFPADRCAAIMVSAARSFLQRAKIVKEIYFCLWDQKTYELFQQELESRG